MTTRRAVFLDRDGTLNHQIVRSGKPYPPHLLSEFSLFPDAIDSCARLKGAGFYLVVATNQPDVERGTQKRDVIESMHAHLKHLIPIIDRIEVCYAPGQGRPHPENYRRKPQPGMLIDAAQALDLDLAQSWMVGDRAGDIDAGHAAGCRTIFLDWGYTESPPQQAPHFTARSLNEAVGIILARS